MKKFVLNFIIYIFLFLTFSNLIAIIILNVPMFSKILDFGPEVYIANINSKKSLEHDIVVVGDSVAHQIFKPFDDVKDDFFDLTTNQAVSMAGQYILIMNIINKNSDVIKEINLVYHPRSFSNNLDQIWTFNYFVKPFFNLNNIKYFSQSVLKKLDNIKLYKIAILPMIKVIPDFPSFDYSKFMKNSNENTAYLSEISIEYLKKIKNECKNRNIEFNVISAPLNIESIDDYAYMKQQISENGLDGIFHNYFDNMIIYEKDVFLDPFHFKKDYLIKNRQLIIDSLIN